MRKFCRFFFHLSVLWNTSNIRHDFKWQAKNKSFFSKKNVKEPKKQLLLYEFKATLYPTLLCCFTICLFRHPPLVSSPPLLLIFKIILSFLYFFALEIHFSSFLFVVRFILFVLSAGENSGIYILVTFHWSPIQNCNVSFILFFAFRWHFVFYSEMEFVAKKNIKEKLY